jgi:anti-sigma regulatory factor (Ser/Thr protein kinase)
MPPHPIAAEQARTLTERVLDDWDLTPLRDNALLVVSELVTNAIRQRDIFLFALQRRDETVLVEVTDVGPGLPTVKNASETDTTGRGLFLVDAVAEEWGVRAEENGGKTVWAAVAK